MRVAFLCKRRYMSKDVILDRYARLYEIPHQLALLGHEVHGFCLDYHQDSEGQWQHDALPGQLSWTSRSLGRLRLPRLLSYPQLLLRRLRQLAPDVIIGSSDIPHVVLGSWLAKQLKMPFMADLYDNFEGFGQAKLPGFVPALRKAVRGAGLVTTTSLELRRLVVEAYGSRGVVMAMPSAVDKAVFCMQDKAAARQALGLPEGARLFGTAGGLYREKGVEVLYEAWPLIRHRDPNAHLVLAGPIEPGYPIPQGERVHYLGSLRHEQVAQLFNALDVGVVCILDTAFGRYSFPQKAYEMLATGLPVVAAEIGDMAALFAATPGSLYRVGDAKDLAQKVLANLEEAVAPSVPVDDWRTIVQRVETGLVALAGVSR